jgi:hypothetical protein
MQQGHEAEQQETQGQQALEQIDAQPTPPAPTGEGE